jgi:peptidylprolyl isomerase/peptidyl-prolyl cis-trans isomerase B (cyclophilin B)
VPTDKRARQKEGRAARQQALLEAQRKQGQRRRIVRFFIPVIILAVAAVILSNRGGDDAADDQSVAAGSAAGCPPKTGAAARKTEFTKAPPMCIDTSKTYLANVKTNKGEFTITLDAKRAPKTVNSFVFLARNKFYDGVKFHRIIPGFVVQGGDPQGTGQGGPGYQFADELPKAGEYKVGSVAMANSGPDTNGSQFFVVTGPEGAQLQPNYTLFGQVTAGLETTVKALEAVGTPGAGTPSEEVMMTSVRITER